MPAADPGNTRKRQLALKKKRRISNPVVATGERDPTPHRRPVTPAKAKKYNLNLRRAGEYQETAPPPRTPTHRDIQKLRTADYRRRGGERVRSGIFGGFRLKSWDDSANYRSKESARLFPRIGDEQLPDKDPVKAERDKQDRIRYLKTNLAAKEYQHAAGPRMGGPLIERDSLRGDERKNAKQELALLQSKVKKTAPGDFGKLLSQSGVAQPRTDKEYRHFLKTGERPVTKFSSKATHGQSAPQQLAAPALWALKQSVRPLNTVAGGLEGKNLVHEFLHGHDTMSNVLGGKHPGTAAIVGGELLNIIADPLNRFGFGFRGVSSHLAAQAERAELRGEGAKAASLRARAETAPTNKGVQVTALPDQLPQAAGQAHVLGRDVREAQQGARRLAHRHEGPRARAGADARPGARSDLPPEGRLPGRLGALPERPPRSRR
jgi:hypothetical protein